MSVIATINIDSRAKLMAAAEELFAEQSYAVTSIREIAGRACINVSLISYYFGSKQALYEEIFRVRLEELRVSLQQLKWKSQTPSEKLDLFLKIYIDRYRVHSSFQRLLYREITSLAESELKETLGRYMRDNIYVLKEILNAGIKEGCFKAVNPSLFFLTILSAMSIVIRDYTSDSMEIECSDCLDVNLKTIKSYLHQILLAESKAVVADLKNE